MAHEKIQGKFYPLQHEEWVRACQELTPSQRDVLYFLRTLDPYGKGIKIIAASIARALSTPQKTVHRQTVSRALKELDAKGFIDLELIEVQVKITSRGYWHDEMQEDAEPEVSTHSSIDDEIQTVCQDTDGVMRHQWCDETPQAIATHHQRSSHTTEDRHAPSKIATHPSESQNRLSSQVQNSKINKTYSDFKKTLSEDEGESFLNFVRKEIINLPKPVNDVEAWLANKNQAGNNRWEVYYNNFKASQKSPNQTVVQKRSLRDEIEQRRQEVKKKLIEESSLNSLSALHDESPLIEEQSSHSDWHEEIQKRRLEARKYLNEQRRLEARKGLTEPGGES